MDTKYLLEELSFLRKKISSLIICKECKYYDNNFCHRLFENDVIEMNENDFCSHGEKRNEQSEEH